LSYDSRDSKRTKSESDEMMGEDVRWSLFFLCPSVLAPISSVKITQVICPILHSVKSYLCVEKKKRNFHFATTDEVKENRSRHKTMNPQLYLID